MSMPVSFLAIASAATFGANAVRNNELEIAVEANAVHIKKIVPPLRAVFDGVAGAGTRSAKVIA